MDCISWARTYKGALVNLQIEKGIPALFAAAQMCHESAANGGAGMSALATEANNYAGLKWAEWEREFGCEPVTYGTWEVLDGQRVDLDDAFCKCADFDQWLRVYSSLLLADRYKGALRYKADPLLYGYQVWKSGWATDPAYFVGIATWIAKLWGDYADTIPPAPYKPVPIVDGKGGRLATGILAVNTTLAPVRRLCESLGNTVGWDAGTDSVTITTPKPPPAPMGGHGTTNRV